MGKLKKGLIKKGTPHPRYPTYKFEDAALTELKANKIENELLDKPGIDATRQVIVPKQYLVYAKRQKKSKGTRISSKMPKLR